MPFLATPCHPPLAIVTLTFKLATVYEASAFHG